MEKYKIPLSPVFLANFSLICILILSSCEVKEKLPNVVILLADDLGCSDVTIYRALSRQIDQPSTSHTPNIDKLAEEGMMMHEFYCGAAVCSPSRSALITGRNATRLGIYNWIPPANNPMHLRDDEWTIAEMLHSVGYQTGHFGKWHLSSEGMNQPLPMDQGFDHAFYTFNNAIPSHHNPNNFHRNVTTVGVLEGYSCQLVVDEAISWIENIEPQKPFFTNIWFHEPHEKVAAPDSLVARHEYNETYYGAIENMDAAIGRLISFLETSDLASNTIFLFTSDNGSQVKGSVGAFRGAKAFNYEGGLRVPFIVKWDGHVKKGTTSNVAGSFVDVLPSLAGLVGVEKGNQKPLDGENLSNVFLGKSDFERKDPIFFYRYFHEPVAMLREGKWILLGYNEKLPYQHRYNTRETAKLKPGPNEPSWAMWGFQESHMKFIDTLEISQYELYDIEKDAAQKDDLSASHPDLVRRLSGNMQQLKEEMIAEGGDWYEK